MSKQKQNRKNITRGNTRENTRRESKRREHNEKRGPVKKSGKQTQSSLSNSDVLTAQALYYTLNPFTYTPTVRPPGGFWLALVTLLQLLPEVYGKLGNRQPTEGNENIKVEVPIFPQYEQPLNPYSSVTSSVYVPLESYTQVPVTDFTVPTQDQSSQKPDIPPKKPKVKQTKIQLKPEENIKYTFDPIQEPSPLQDIENLLDKPSAQALKNFQVLVEEKLQKIKFMFLQEEISFNALKIFYGTGKIPKNLAKEWDGLTPLHIHKSYEKIKFLLLQGLDINHKANKNYFECTPLHYAVINENLLNQLENLLQAAADTGVKIDFKSKDIQGKTPLLLAARMGSEDMVETILQYDKDGSSVNEPDPDGKTPLHYACLLGKKGMVEKLITKGADMNKKDRWGNTCWHYLAQGQGVIETNFLGVAIDPKRNSRARHNNFGYFSTNGRYAQARLSEGYFQQYQFTKGDRYNPKESVNGVLWHKDNIDKMEKVLKNNKEMDPEARNRLQKSFEQARKLMGKFSITKECLNGKDAVAKFLVEKGLKPTPNNEGKLPSELIPTSNKKMAGIREQLSQLEKAMIAKEKSIRVFHPRPAL